MGMRRMKDGPFFMVWNPSRSRINGGIMVYMPFDPMYFYGTYRVPSARKPGRDYTSGSYFITICTHERVPWFGAIRDGRVGLSRAGEIVADEWRMTGIIRPYVTLDEWVIMPNHFHGIVMIRSWDVFPCVNVETSRGDVSTPTYETTPIDALSPLTPRLRPRSLGAIVNQFKSVCTKRIRANGFPDFKWQPGYHDRIIRDADAMESVRAYIKNNPAKWWEKHRPDRRNHIP